MTTPWQIFHLPEHRGREPHSPCRPVAPFRFPYPLDAHTRHLRRLPIPLISPPPSSRGRRLPTNNYLPITTLHLMPAGIRFSGFGNCRRMPNVPLAASISLSTTTTLA